jgi:hypothetical protein
MKFAVKTKMPEATTIRSIFKTDVLAARPPKNPNA